MKRKQIFTTAGIFLLAFAAGYYFMNTESQDPREKYKQYLIEEYSKLPADIAIEAEGENRPDRPDLAAIQNYFNIIDPALKTVPSERLITAWEQTKEMQASALRQSNTLFWETEGSNMGGRTRAIMYDPNEPGSNKVWAGSVTGGLWYNDDITDDNSSWMAAEALMSNISVSCLVSDPQDPQIFYMGTGEAETARVIYRESSGVGMGILKSNDGGNSWESLTGTESFKYVTDIQLKVEDGISVIYAAVASGYYHGSQQSQPANGLYRSDDGGITWQQVLPLIPGTDETYAVSDIKIQSDGRIYVGSMETPDLKGGGTIFYSDAGTTGTWTVYEDVKTLIENQSTENIPGRVILAMAPSDPSIVYALFAVGYEDGFVYYAGRYIFRTTNSGASWEQVNLPDYDYATLSWHALVCAIDPLNPEHIYAGGLDVWSTQNAGSSWSQQSDWALMYYGGGDDYVHADQHVQLYKEGSNEEMLFGSDGGIFYTSNASSSNPVFEEKNKNYSTLQFYTCAISPVAADNRYIGGLQDNGTLFFQGDPLDINDMIDGGDGAGCFWDKNEPNIFITSVYYNRYSVFVDGYYYNDAGEYSGTFICPADYDYKQNIIYANATSFGGSRPDQLLRVTGIPYSSYEAYIALGTGSSLAFTHVKYSPYSPDNASTLFVGGQTGRVFKVENANILPQVTEITGDDFPAGAVSCIAIGGSEDTLLVTFSNYGVPSVWQTYDGGDNWAMIEGNLPDMPVRYALYHPNDAKQVMLATELGIFTCNHTHLEDPQWSPDNDGLTNVRIDMIQLREADNTVLAATHGRGLYTTSWVSNPWVSVPEIEALDVDKIWPNPVRESLNIHLGTDYSENINLKVTDIRGRKVLETTLEAGQEEYTINLEGLRAGTYLLLLNNGQRSYSEKIIKQ